MSNLESLVQQQFNDHSSDVFPEWFNQIRQQAYNDYLTKGLPTRKTEAWKYTSIENLKKQALTYNPVIFHGQSKPSEINIENGQVSLPETLPEGLKVIPLSQALKEKPALWQIVLQQANDSHNHSFDCMNTALINEGVCFIVEKDKPIEQPININYCNTQDQINTNYLHLFYLEQGARLEVIEHFNASSSFNYLNNQQLICYQEKNSHFNYIKVIEESEQASHIGKFKACLENDAILESHLFSLTGGIVRSDMLIDLKGSGATATLNGMYLTAGNQQSAQYTRVNHLCPSANSNEFYKGILGGSSQAVFNGAVFVAKDAQKTQAVQQNKNLLLSKKAQCNTKPQLEIFADDVKCAHGATIGQIEDNALFYLQSRGIAKSEAVNLLVKAFAGDLIEKLSDSHKSLQEYLYQQVEKRIGQAYES